MFFAVFASMLHKYNFEQVLPTGEVPAGWRGNNKIDMQIATDL